MNLEQGIEMLKIFKDHDARTCILDDFDFYNEREKSLKERKARQQTSSIKEAPNVLTDDSVNKISDSFGQSLRLKESGEADTLQRDVSSSMVNHSTEKTSESLSRAEASDNCQN